MKNNTKKGKGENPLFPSNKKRRERKKMYTIIANNGFSVQSENLKSARKIASRFFRISKNRRYGFQLNFYTCAAITKNGKMIYSIDNQGTEKIYSWNF